MAGVTSSASLAAFLAALEKCRLLSADELAQATSDLGEHHDAKSAARELVKQGRLSRWQAGQLMHGYHQLKIGNYRLVDQLGSGELGRVYLAEHGQLNRRVALKVLSRRHMSDPKILQGFLADARRAGGLDHRNICHVYDVTQEGDRCCVVMEYVEGSDLQTVGKSGPQPLGRVVEIARQIAEGLGHAHQNGVVHGDLTPSNLLLDKHGCIKIVDMGVARLTDNAKSPGTDESGEGPNLAAGIYRSPEQIAGGAATSVSDWFSLGGVICHLLSSTPFDANEAALSLKHLEAKRTDLNAGLLELLKSLTALNPEDRPKSAAEVTTALDAAASSAVAQPVVVTPTAKLPPVLKGKPPIAGAGQAIPKSEAQASKPPRRPPVARSLDEPTPAATESGGFTLEGLSLPGSDTGAFSFNALETTGPKNPPVKVATAPKKAVPKTTAASAVTKDATSGSSKSSRRLLIGGAIGAAALAIAGIVVLVVVLTTGDDKPSVASATAKSQPKKAASKDSEKVATTSEETPVDKSSPPGPPAVKKALAAADSPTPATTAVTGSEVPPAAVTETSPTEPAPTPAPAATAASPLVTVDPDKMALPAPATPAPPVPAAAPAAEPGPQSLADVVAAEAAPAPAATPAPAPVAEPSPAAPATTGDPFAGLPKMVKLAELPSTAGGELSPAAQAPVTIGSLKLPADAIVAVDLNGVESAFKGGKQTYSIEAANGGTAQRDWEISCGADANQLAVIALLSAKDDQLTFQWTPEAAKNSAAGNLCNCQVEMRAGPVTHAIALREPIVGEPLGLELDKPGQPARWLIPNLPDPQSIELEIASFETAAPKSKLESKSLSVSQPTTQALLGVKEEEFPLGFELTFAVQPKGLLLTAAPKIKIQGLPPGKDKYNKKAVQQLIIGAGNAQKIGDAGSAASEQIKDAGDKKKAKAQFDEMKVSGAKASEQLADLQTLAESAKSGRVHVRAWYLTGGAKVLLLDTGGPPPAAAP